MHEHCILVQMHWLLTSPLRKQNMVFFVSLSEGERFTSYLVRWANDLFYCMMMFREFGGTIAKRINNASLYLLIESLSHAFIEQCKQPNTQSEKKIPSL